MAILDAQYPMLDLHTRAVLVKLSQADDGVPQCGDVVDTGEHPVLASLGGEDDGANTLDLHGEGVPELDVASQARVQVREELTLTSHAVRGTGVELPAVDLVIVCAFAEEGVGTRFVEVEMCGASRRGKGKAWTFHPLPCFLLRLDTPVHLE